MNSPLFQPTEACEHMIKGQIRTGHVLDEQVVNALLSVDRTRFVPEGLQNSAYIDEEIPLGAGRFLIEPLAFSRLIMAAALTKHDVVLDIGAGSGYSSAVISYIAQHVIALEEDSDIEKQAQKLLHNYSNIECITGALNEGYHLRAPYDAIIIEGAIEFIPQTLIDQLKEGGRLVAFMLKEAARLSTHGFGHLVHFQKINGAMHKTILQDAGIPLLNAFRKPAAFTL